MWKALNHLIHQHIALMVLAAQVPQIFQQSARLIMNSMIEFSGVHVEMLINKFRKGWKQGFSLNGVDRFSFGIGFEIEARLNKE